MKLTEYFELSLKADRIYSHFTKELRFDPERKWRSDYADIKRKIIVEIEGAVWTGGRHTGGSGFINDCEKYNSATMGGWRVFRLATKEHAESFIEWYQNEIKTC